MNDQFEQTAAKEPLVSGGSRCEVGLGLTGIAKPSPTNVVLAKVVKTKTTFTPAS